MVSVRKTHHHRGKSQHYKAETHHDKATAQHLKATTQQHKAEALHRARTHLEGMGTSDG